MHNLTLTDQELRILKIIGNYATNNDAYIFVADEFVIDDDKAQKIIRQFNTKIQNLN